MIFRPNSSQCSCGHRTVATLNNPHPPASIQMRITKQNVLGRHCNLLPSGELLADWSPWAAPQSRGIRGQNLKCGKHWLKAFTNPPYHHTHSSTLPRRASQRFRQVKPSNLSSGTTAKTTSHPNWRYCQLQQSHLNSKPIIYPWSLVLSLTSEQWHSRLSQQQYCKNGAKRSPWPTWPCPQRNHPCLCQSCRRHQNLDIQVGHQRRVLPDGPQSRGGVQLAYVLPQEANEPIPLVVPTFFQMGLVEPPPYFCTAIEAAWSIASQYCDILVGSFPPHKFVKHVMLRAILWYLGCVYKGMVQRWVRARYMDTNVCARQ